MIRIRYEASPALASTLKEKPGLDYIPADVRLETIPVEVRARLHNLRQLNAPNVFVIGEYEYTADSISLPRLKRKVVEHIPSAEEALADLLHTAISYKIAHEILVAQLTGRRA